ncbi:MAG: hypothetical protein FJ406_10220 [Verrucomicrobia bacterium]|nr:hypothetical protein [Verrucomicrobiota bacterium]MBM3871132.1 hypothetical protein [Verrucomicrobiota bacterium]
MSRLTIVLACALLATGVARAAIESGPAVDSTLPELKADAATGEDAGKRVTFTTTRKGKPTVYVFVRGDKFDRPIGRYLKNLDKALTELGKNTHVVAVWLTDDVDKTREYLPKVQQSIKLEATTFAFYAEGKDGPNAWAINDRAFVTTIVTDGTKVKARFAEQSLNETNVPEVTAALKPLVK